MKWPRARLYSSWRPVRPGTWREILSSPKWMMAERARVDKDPQEAPEFVLEVIAPN